VLKIELISFEQIIMCHFGKEAEANFTSIIIPSNILQSDPTTSKIIPKALMKSPLATRPAKNRRTNLRKRPQESL
jgi:hypothetical protein